VSDASRAVGRFTAVDRDSLLTAVLAVGTLLAVGLFVFGGFLAGLLRFGLGPLLYVFALALPIWGIVFAVAVLRWYAEFRDERRDSFTEQPPESGVTDATEPVGQSTAQDLAGSMGSRYTCVEHPSASEIQETLQEGAVRRTRTRNGHDDATARAVVAEGEWTDDPVAAAFLSERVQYPLIERLRAAVDPGAAYVRRVSRTVDAIEGSPDWQSDGEAAETDGDAAEADDGSATAADQSREGSTGQGDDGSPAAEGKTGPAETPIREVAE